MSVLLVLTNFMRTRNLSNIISAYERQSMTVDKMVIVDNHPPNRDEFTLKEEHVKHFDDVYSMKENLGPSCRFVPALADLKSDYVLFADDDFLPQRNFVQHLVETAEKLEGNFATIGGVGRRFRVSRPKYISRNVGRSEFVPTPVDMTCRFHLVRRDYLSHAIKFRDDVIRRHIDHEHLDIALHHDDMILCLGIQREIGFPSFMTSLGKNVEIKNINYENAFSSRNPHVNVRTLWIKFALNVGWSRKWNE